MIPAFTPDGLLPPGVHPATPDEIRARFGTQSAFRRTQWESIEWLVAVAARAGVQRIVLNGSFVTDIIEPNDVDCVLLVGAEAPPDIDAERVLREGLPFLEIQLVDAADFDYFVNDFFATDRVARAKGMIEVIEWS